MTPAELEAAQIRSKVKALRETVRRAELYEQLAASPAWAQLQSDLTSHVTDFQLYGSMRLPLGEIPEARGKAARSQEIIELVLTASNGKMQHLREIERLEGWLEAAVKTGMIQPTETD